MVLCVKKSALQISNQWEKEEYFINQMWMVRLDMTDINSNLSLWIVINNLKKYTYNNVMKKWNLSVNKIT